MIKEYYNNLKMLKTLEKIFSSSGSSGLSLEKNIESLQGIVEENKDDLQKKIDAGDVDYKDIPGLNKDQQDAINKYMKNKEHLSESDIKNLLEEVRDSAPTDWRPSEEFVEFYKKTNKDSSYSMDIYDLSSMFIGVERDYIEKAKFAYNPISWIYSNIFQEYFPEQYYSSLKKVSDVVLDSISTDLKVVYYKKFIDNIGGEKEFAKLVLQIATADDYSGVIDYEGGQVSLSKSDANIARKNISSAMFSALFQTVFSSGKEVKSISESYIQFPIKGGRITSKYGDRLHPKYKKIKFHYGLDIAAPIGTEIKSIMIGSVVKIGNSKGFGKYVYISHKNGYVSKYSHCSKIKVKEGQNVDLDTVIALVGNTGISTGPHLHLEVKKDGITMDPLEILRE